MNNLDMVDVGWVRDRGLFHDLSIHTLRRWRRDSEHKDRGKRTEMERRKRYMIRRTGDSNGSRGLRTKPGDF